MNIQLFLENEELELDKGIPFALNKEFEHLFNPTDIIVEHSKTINIPCTANNNRIMANAYRIDRQFVNNDSKNIGLNLDPLKRIPMKLVYNGEILLDGYAKYSGATVNNKDSYYTFNIYGVLGDVFQTLLDCVFDENKLTDEQKAEPDGGQKYIIKEPWYAETINKEFIKRCWDTDDPDITFTSSPYNSIGFAPAYRGAYNDFASDTIYGLGWRTVLDGTPKEEGFEDAVKRYWKNNLIGDGMTEEDADTVVNSVDFNSIVPDGVLEHNLRQFRSYEQKPYIYFYALMDLYKRKCEELTDYKINLDPTWFSSTNPYWTRLCYMFDYLSVNGVSKNAEMPFTGYNSRTYSDFPEQRVVYEVSDPEVINNNDLLLKSFTLSLNTKCTPNSNHLNPAIYGKVGLIDVSEVFVDIEITTGGVTTTKHFWGGLDYTKAGSNDEQKYNASNFIQIVNKTLYDGDVDELIGNDYMTIPGFKIPHSAGDYVSIAYNIKVGWHRVGAAMRAFAYYYNGELVKYLAPNGNTDANFKVTLPNTFCVSNWRNSTTTKMKDLYSGDESLFKVILQYTKMFGLVWNVDYNNKTINILTRKSYFKDYSIVDWTDKVAKNKGMTIEPVSFNSKYVKFNYKDTNGYRYSGYKSKYNVDYGEKRLKTKYNFDTAEYELFKNTNISPSSSSCKSYVIVNELLATDGVTGIPYTPSELDFIDCEDENESGAISMNNWYFRCENKETEQSYYISDVSEMELIANKYFWVDNEYGMNVGCVTSTSNLPVFSPAFKAESQFVNFIGTTLGCLYNCPNEDYTKDKAITAAEGNYIYDNCWSDYINERYNSNNKKLTCYVKLSPIEFKDFNFKKFIIIDNQLFTINKIIDFNMNESLTKVELIQVSNINGYTSQKLSFPAIAFDKSEINITAIAGSYGVTGRGSIKISCYPSLSRNQWSINTVTTGSSESKIAETDVEKNNTTTTIYIYYESDGLYNEEFELVINFDGETYRIPIIITPLPL